MGVAIAVVGLIALVGGLLLVLRSVMRQRMAVWRRVSGPMGGEVRFVLSLRGTLRMTVPMGDGSITIDQWTTVVEGPAGSSGGPGQLVMTVALPRPVEPFFVGKMGWASAFARWAHDLPECDGLDPERAPALAMARAANRDAMWTLLSAAVQAELIGLGAFVLFGRGRELRVHVPGGVTDEVHLPLLERTVDLGRAILSADR